MFKINEIFYSVQGEGFFSGTPAIFLRFSGCNLKCPFCDTTHEQGQMMGLSEILSKVSAYPAKHIVLTGGEPSLFVNETFISELKDAGFFVQIETNGTRVIPCNIDWVTFSPKEDYVLKKADELKIVYTGQDLSVYKNFNCRYKFLQPCSGLNTGEVLEYVMQNPEWKISVQLHKYLDIR